MGGGGLPGLGSNNQAASAPPATIPAPAAIAIATVSPAELVVVMVVGVVTESSSSLTQNDVGVKVAAIVLPSTVAVVSTRVIELEPDKDSGSSS